MTDEELEVTQNEVPAESGGEGTDVPDPEVPVLGDPAPAVTDELAGEDPAAPEEVTGEDPAEAEPEELEEYEYEILAETPDEHPFYGTNFADFTVTEGLLLLIFVILLVDFFMNLVRRFI